VKDRTETSHLSVSLKSCLLPLSWNAGRSFSTLISELTAELVCRVKKVNVDQNNVSVDNYFAQFYILLTVHHVMILGK